VMREAPATRRPVARDPPPCCADAEPLECCCRERLRIQHAPRARQTDPAATRAARSIRSYALRAVPVLRTRDQAKARAQPTRSSAGPAAAAREPASIAQPASAQRAPSAAERTAPTRPG